MIYLISMITLIKPSHHFVEVNKMIKLTKTVQMKSSQSYKS